MISTRSCGFSPAAGSSTRRSRGSDASAIAISSRHRLAKDRAAAGWGQRSGGNRPGNIARISTTRSRARRSSSRVARPATTASIQRGAEPCVHRGQHVVEQAHAPEELPRLEGPRQTESADLVRGTARRAPRGARAREEDRARIGPVEAGQTVEERRLARAVGADQTHDLAGRDHEIHPVDRDQPAESLGEAPHGEERPAARAQSSRDRGRGTTLPARERPDRRGSR